jgi:hypothetical protein
MRGAEPRSREFNPQTFNIGSESKLESLETLQVAVKVQNIVEVA